MGLFEHQNKLVIKFIEDYIKKHNEVEYNKMIAIAVIEFGKAEQNIERKILLLKRCNRIVYKKDKERIMLCPSE